MTGGIAARTLCLHHRQVLRLQLQLMIITLAPLKGIGQRWGT